MSKSIKIKAFAILIAWTVIFLHNIIPHLHEQDQSCGNKNIIHEISCDNLNNGYGSVVNGQPVDHEKVCHYNGLLFQLVNYDNLLFHPEKKIHSIAVLLTESSLYHVAYIDFSEPETDNTSLRAPPVS